MIIMNLSMNVLLVLLLLFICKYTLLSTTISTHIYCVKLDQDRLKRLLKKTFEDHMSPKTCMSGVCCKSC